jgi:hypothetical protein
MEWLKSKEDKRGTTKDNELPKEEIEKLSNQREKT